MKKYGLFFIILILCNFMIFAQNDSVFNNKSISLFQILELSKNSAEAKIAKHNFLESYWEYKSINAERLPEMVLTGTLPQFNRTIGKTTLPDGKETFVSQFYGDYSANLQITQVIPYTNTKIFISSGLERLDMYGQDKSTSYLSNPFNIGISQSLFSYNAEKWKQKINPIKYNAAKQRFLEDIEDVSVKTVDLYFNLLIVQEKLRNAINNKIYADTLEFIAKEKYISEKIVESEYLQVQLNTIKSEYQVEILNNEWRDALSKLKSFLQIENNDFWELETPESTLPIQVSSAVAIEQATENSALFHEFRQRELEAQSNLLRSKTENRFNVDIYANFGLNQNAGSIANVYTDLRNQEILSVGLRIPIWDWGKTRGKIKIAESQKEVTLLQISQEQKDFERNLILKIAEYNTQTKQLDIAMRATEIADKRLEAEKLRYILGKGDFTHLHEAITDKEQYLYSYLDALRKYWSIYYEIRKSTLFDFENNRKIEVDFREMLK